MRSRSGGWNRRGPTGGSAYGMPRYSDTPVAFDAACPSTGPLLVWTVWPTFHVPCREVALAAADAAANSRAIPLIVLFMFKRHQTRPCYKWIEDLLTKVDSVAASSKDEKIIITLTLHCSFILYFMLLSNEHQNCRGDDAQLGPVGRHPPVLAQSRHTNHTTTPASKGRARRAISTAQSLGSIFRAGRSFFVYP